MRQKSFYKQIAIVTLLAYSTLTDFALTIGNVLLNKPVDGTPGTPGNDLALAVDGDQDVTTTPNPCYSSIVEADPLAYWFRVDMGAGTVVKTVFFTAREDCCTEKIYFTVESKTQATDISDAYITVGDNPDIKLNPQCPEMITESGWFSCSTGLTGRYFGIWPQNPLAVPLNIVEVKAYPDEYVTHLAVGHNQSSGGNKDASLLLN